MYRVLGAALIVLALGLTPGSTRAGSLALDLALDGVVSLPSVPTPSGILPATQGPLSGSVSIVLSGVDSLGGITAVSPRGVVRSLRAEVALKGTATHSLSLPFATVSFAARLQQIDRATGVFDGAQLSLPGGGLQLFLSGTGRCQGSAAICAGIPFQPTLGTTLIAGLPFGIALSGLATVGAARARGTGVSFLAQVFNGREVARRFVPAGQAPEPGAPSLLMLALLGLAGALRARRAA